MTHDFLSFPRERRREEGVEKSPGRVERKRKKRYACPCQPLLSFFLHHVWSTWRAPCARRERAVGFSRLTANVSLVDGTLTLCGLPSHFCCAWAGAHEKSFACAGCLVSVTGKDAGELQVLGRGRVRLRRKDAAARSFVGRTEGSYEATRVGLVVRIVEDGGRRGAINLEDLFPEGLGSDGAGGYEPEKVSSRRDRLSALAVGDRKKSLDSLEASSAIELVNGPMAERIPERDQGINRSAEIVRLVVVVLGDQTDSGAAAIAARVRLLDPEEGAVPPRHAQLGLLAGEVADESEGQGTRGAAREEERARRQSQARENRAGNSRGEAARRRPGSRLRHRTSLHPGPRLSSSAAASS